MGEFIRVWDFESEMSWSFVVVVKSGSCFWQVDGIAVEASGDEFFIDGGRIDDGDGELFGSGFVCGWCLAVLDLYGKGKCTCSCRYTTDDACRAVEAEACGQGVVGNGPGIGCLSSLSEKSVRIDLIKRCRFECGGRDLKRSRAGVVCQAQVIKSRFHMHVWRLPGVADNADMIRDI